MKNTQKSIYSQIRDEVRKAIIKEHLSIVPPDPSDPNDPNLPLSGGEMPEEQAEQEANKVLADIQRMLSQYFGKK